MADKQQQGTASFTVTFESDAKRQLDQLRDYFHLADEFDVLKKGIAFLQYLKEKKEQKQQMHVSS